MTCTWLNFAKDMHWVQTPKWQDVNLWKRVILKVQSLWKRGLSEWEAILRATHPSTAPTKEFPNEIHVRASAKDQSPGNSKITSIIYYFSASTSSTFGIHLVLEWNQNFSNSIPQQDTAAYEGKDTTKCNELQENFRKSKCPFSSVPSGIWLPTYPVCRHKTPLS